MALRLRQDAHWWQAGAKRAILLGARPDPRKDDSKNWDPLYLRELNDPTFEEAKPGDVWRLVIDPDYEAGKGRTYSWLPKDGWILGGYAIWCPKEDCNEGVHWWSHATDCKGMYGEPCKYGERPGQSSCWLWTGSVEEGNLTAEPSLFASGSCGWHGFLRQGEMVSV